MTCSHRRHRARNHGHERRFLADIVAVASGHIAVRLQPVGCDLFARDRAVGQLGARIGVRLHVSSSRCTRAATVIEDVGDGVLILAAPDCDAGDTVVELHRQERPG
jgi:hypothetical protein